MGKRRGGIEENTVHMDRNNNRILHIRQTWDSNKKITPTSSMKTSEFSKINQMEDSEFSSDKTFTESFNHNQKWKLEKEQKFYNSEPPKKHENNPKIKQKILESLKGMQKQSNSFHPNSKNIIEKKESFDIISKAKEVCDNFLKQIDQKNLNQNNFENLLCDSNLEKSKELCESESK